MFAQVQLKQPVLLFRSGVSTEAKHSCREFHWFRFCLQRISIWWDSTTWHVKTIIKSFVVQRKRNHEAPSAFNGLHSENGHVEVPSGCDRMTTNSNWSNNFKYLSIHHACPQQHYAQSLVRADGALDDQTTGARSVHSQWPWPYHGTSTWVESTKFVAASNVHETSLQLSLPLSYKAWPGRRLQRNTKITKDLGHT